MKSAKKGSLHYSVNRHSKNKSKDSNKIKLNFSKKLNKIENRDKTSDAEGENLAHCKKL